MITFGHGEAIGSAGKLHFIRTARAILVGVYASPCDGVLHARVPLPEWPNAAANEDHYFGPLEEPC